MLKKIVQRLTDPVFYRKRWRNLRRTLRQSKTPPSKLLSADNLDICRRVLVVLAHPDDETFCSGLLSHLAENGAVIRVLCLTRGEGGATGDISGTRIGEIRSREMEKSCARLGVDDVQFLGYIDPPGWEHRTFAPKVSPVTLSRVLHSHLTWFDPCLVITHGSTGEYWHPAHELAHRATLRAIARHRETLEHPLVVATTNAWQSDHPLPELLNRDDRPHLVHHSTAAQLERRLLALLAHHSQQALFEKFANGSCRDFIDQTATEAYRIRVFTPPGDSRQPFKLPRWKPETAPSPGNRPAETANR